MYKIFIHGSHNIQIQYISKTLIPNKRELVFDKEKKILSQKYEIVYPKNKENWYLISKYGSYHQNHEIYIS